MIPNNHRNFVEKVVETLKNDIRIVGVQAGGSYITSDMDEYSDLDFVIIVEPDKYEEVMSERTKIAESFGDLASSFIGFHVGEPRLLICLYGPEPLHVDLKFVSLDDAAKRVEDAVMLWERNNRVTEKQKEEEAVFPIPTLQFIEDRMWIWVHYGATKIGRGEVFQTLDFISAMRNMVVGPLLLMKNGQLPKGVRKLEIYAKDSIEDLKETVAEYDIESCIRALYKIIDMYLELREEFISDDFVKREEAQKLSVEYLDKVANKNNNK